MHGDTVNTKDLHAVRQVVEGIFSELFPSRHQHTLGQAFEWVSDAFAGKFDGFQAIDAKYHDLEHTLQGTLALARLLRGYARAKAEPRLTERAFELGIVAILLHDTGYLKNRADVQGTGAKYTAVHVSRSVEFAAVLLTDKNFPQDEIQSVQNMIRCTGLNADLAAIPFRSLLEQKVGFALGTADLLGQMAAPDYIDKLATLYQEFEEASKYSGKTTGGNAFKSAADLRSNTPQFWESYVRPKIQHDFGGLYRYLDEGDTNPYLQRIEANISRLQRELSAAPA